MSGFKDAGFAERLETAARARKALLEKFRAVPGPSDPRVVEKRAARQAVGTAREVRAVDRKAKRDAEREAESLAQQAALTEQAEREAAERVARAEREAAERDARVEREAATAAEQKAARDARYAARKARR